jgi:transcriptional regulator with XRE-family HTH domain
MRTPPRTPGERVAFQRGLRGLTQDELARRTGHTAGWVAEVESGAVALGWGQELLRLAAALGVTAEDLAPEAVAAAIRARMPGLPELLRAVTAAPSAPESETALWPRPGDGLTAAEARALVAGLWDLVHASRQSEMAVPAAAELIVELERAARSASAGERGDVAAALAEAYRLAAMVLARRSQPAAAQIARERAAHAMALAGGPAAAVGRYRMAKAQLLDGRGRSLRAAPGPAALPPPDRDERTTELATLAMVVADLAERAGASWYPTWAAIQAAEPLDQRNPADPRRIAELGVEFAAGLGDADLALAWAARAEAAGLPAQRRALLLVTVARAHEQRSAPRDTLVALLAAERVAARPAELRADPRVRDLVLHLLAEPELADSPELRHLAGRCLTTR